MLTVFLCVLSVTVAYDASTLCGTTPPSLWCENEALAKECGWDLACSEYKKTVYNKPVLLTLLYESLCPGCQNFIVNELYPNVFKKFPASVVQIELVPFGNAKITPVGRDFLRMNVQDGSISCQHGEEECRINKFEGCLIDSMETADQYIPAIHCIEQQLMSKNPLEKAATRCFRLLNVTDSVQRMTQSCLVSKLSTQLQQQAAVRTNNVQPEKHDHVPWVLFNNASIGSAQLLLSDLPNAICQWYKGDTVPKPCEIEKRRTLKFAQRCAATSRPLP